MANSKTIELILQAKLEESDSTITQAAKIGQGIRSAFEAAFTGLGFELAQRFLTDFNQEVRSGGRGGFLGSNTPIAPVPQSPRELVDATGRSYKNEILAKLDQNRTSEVISTKDLARDQDRVIKNSLSNERDINSLDKTGLMTKLSLARKLRSTGVKNVEDIVLGEEGKDLTEIGKKIKFSENINQVRNENQKESIKLYESIINLNKEIEELKRSIDNNTEATEEEKKEQFIEYDQKRNLRNQNLRELEQRGVLESQLDEIGRPKESAFGLPKGLITAAQIGGAVGVGATLMGSMNKWQLQNEAGQAQLERMNTRDILNGNDLGFLATERLGGQRALEERARSNAFLNTIGRGIAQPIVGGITGAAAGGIPGAVAGATIGTISGGISLFSDFAKQDVLTSQEAQELKQAQQNKDQEVNSIYLRGKEIARQTHRTALSLGSDQFYDFLTGGGRNGIVQRSARAGLGEDITRQGLTSLAQGIGGVFNGDVLLNDKRLRNQITENNVQLKSRGINSIDELSAAMYRGGNNFGQNKEGQIQAMSDAFARANQLSFSALRSGVDQSYVSKMLGEVAAEGGRGPGAMDQAIYNAQAALGAAQQQGLKAAPQVENLYHAQQKMMQGMNTGAGIPAMARAMAIEEMASKYHVNLSPETKQLMQLNTLSDKNVKEIFKSSGASLQEFNKLNMDKFTGYFQNRGGLAIKASQLSETGTFEGASEVLKMLQSPGNLATEDLGAKIGKKISAGREAESYFGQVDATKTIEGFRALANVLPRLENQFPQFVDQIVRLADATSKGYFEKTSLGSLWSSSGKPMAAGTAGPMTAQQAAQQAAAHQRWLER